MTSYPPLINSHTKEETQRLNFFFAMQKACTPLPVRDKFSLISDEYLSVWKSEKKNYTDKTRE